MTVHRVTLLGAIPLFESLGDEDLSVISLRGPGQISFDASVFKTFSLMEKLQAQFRAEALNISNTPTFYGPNTTFTNPQFGIITSQANYPRLIQMGVRFYR